jgi:predicted nucleic acid-binding protein
VPTYIFQTAATIAATALVHGLTVVTRNVQDFDDTGVIVVDPWQD